MTIGRIPSVEGGIQPTIVDAKGDLIAGVAADSINRLAVGSNDQVLVADSSTSTGLAWKSVATPFAAGKNKVINGAFDIWQRGTSFSLASGYNFTADRFSVNRNGTGATVTISQQTFTPGSAPVAGYEGKYFWRFNQSVAGSSGTFNVFGTAIEDVQTFAGQTITISFWAKADAARTLSVTPYQSFGTGGSSTVNPGGQNVTLSTSWTRYSATFTMGSLSGKTIGSGSFFGIEWGMPVNTVQTIDVWGIQAEVGSVATPFTTATGTIQGELAACQRYYWRATDNNTYSVHATGWATSTTAAKFALRVPTTMRVIPTSIDYSGLGVGVPGASMAALTNLTIGTTESALNTIYLNATVASGLTSGATYVLQNNNNTGHYIGCSAEL